MEKGTATGPRKIMVVVDPSRESAAALQYALSHGVVEKDELILLHIASNASWRNTISTLFKRSNNSIGSNSCYGDGSMSHGGGSSGRGVVAGGGGGGGGDGGGGGGGEVDFLEQMKHVCEMSQPKVRLRVERVEMEGRDRASMILSQSTLHNVDVLIIGQRRSLTTAILGARRAGGSGRGLRMMDTAEYLIEHSKCTCVAVQRKGQNAGYLLNTKTYRNFWLLA